MLHTYDSKNYTSLQNSIGPNDPMTTASMCVAQRVPKCKISDARHCTNELLDGIDTHEGIPCFFQWQNARYDQSTWIVTNRDPHQALHVPQVVLLPLLFSVG